MVDKRDALRVGAAFGFAIWGIAALVPVRFALTEAWGWEATWRLGLACGGGAAVCFLTAGFLLSHRTGIRQAGMLLGVAYLLCWSVTATLGTRDVEPPDAASFAKQFGLPESVELVRQNSMPDLSADRDPAHTPPSISAGQREGSFYAAAGLPVTPFLLRLDYAYLASPLQGEAGSEFYIWFFGYRLRVAGRVFWMA